MHGKLTNLFLCCPLMIQEAPAVIRSHYNKGCAIESLIETKASRIDSLPASYHLLLLFSPKILLQKMNMMSLFGFGRRKASWPHA
jgi:hypothetical protein